MHTAWSGPARWHEYTGTMFACCICASVCDSPPASHATLRATGRPARSPCRARYTRPNAPRPSSRSMWKPRYSSPGLGNGALSCAHADKLSALTSGASLGAPAGQPAVGNMGEAGMVVLDESGEGR